MNQQFDVTWIDGGREPQVAPNPAYPDGIDVNGARSAANHCTVSLPYPARRCGHYRIICNLCGFSMVCTTAGRRDDPRSVTMPCKPAIGAKH